MIVDVKGKKLNIDDELARRYCAIPYNEIDEQRCLSWIRVYYTKKINGRTVHLDMQQLFKEATDAELVDALNTMIEKELELHEV